MPPFGIAVASSSDVSAALRFAFAHRLRVAVKSSGHDYQGRSTAANGLLIWMHRLQARPPLADAAAAAPAEGGPLPLLRRGSL